MNDSIIETIPMFIDSIIDYNDNGDYQVFTLENNKKYTIEKCKKDLELFQKIFEKYPELHDELPTMSGGKARVVVFGECDEEGTYPVISQHSIHRDPFEGEIIPDRAVFALYEKLMPSDGEHDNESIVHSFVDKNNMIVIHPVNVNFLMSIKPTKEIEDYVNIDNYKDIYQDTCFEIAFEKMTYVETLCELIYYYDMFDDKLRYRIFDALCDADIKKAYESLLNHYYFSSELFGGKMPYTNNDINKRDIMSVVSVRMKRIYIDNITKSLIVPVDESIIKKSDIELAAHILSVTPEELEKEIKTTKMKKHKWEDM